MPRYIHLLILLTLLQIASCTKTPTSPIWNGSADTSWYTADTSATEFTITTAEQLAGIAKLVNDSVFFKGKTIRLGQNIMLNDTADWKNWESNPPQNKWMPIGTKDNPFRGIFDGNEFRIIGVYVLNKGEDWRFESEQGLFGYIEERATIKNLGVIASYVKGEYNVGGLVGKAMECFISNSYFNGIVIGKGSGVGGLLGSGEMGWVEGCDIHNSYSTGEVTGDQYVGGLVGRGENVINNGYFHGTVTGNREVGGLVGSNSYIISNSYFNGTVTGSTIVLEFLNKVIENKVIGGLVGQNVGGDIINSYSAGTVTGNTIVGGLVGYNYGGKISKSYSVASVSGKSIVGGFAAGNTGEISDSYYAGKLNGKDSTDGFLVQNRYSSKSDCPATMEFLYYRLDRMVEHEGKISNSYYDKELSGQNNACSEGEGKTTAEMKSKATFANWDFEETWSINKKINNGYPHLQENNEEKKSSRKTKDLTISTPRQLIEFVKMVNEGNDFKGKIVKLENDIMLNDTANWKNWDSEPPANKWPSIGRIYTNTFSGTFDGNGKVISGVYKTSENNRQGLFSYLNSEGTIKNLGLAASYIKGGNETGGLVGINNGTISKCYSASTVTGKNRVGGLVGSNNGTISESYSVSMVTGDEHVGEIVGFNVLGTISSSYSAGIVKGESDVGGLLGFNYYKGASVNNCYSASMVTGVNDVGGLIGHSENAISHSYFTGTVTGVNNVGGLVGNTDDSISNSYSTGRVTGKINVGGLAGESGTSSINNNYSTGDVTGEVRVGGLIGNSGPSMLSNNYSIGKVSGEKDVGGLVGYKSGVIWSKGDIEYNGTISNSYYNTQTGGQGKRDFGEGKTTEQMKQKSTFRKWDFENVWGIDSTINNGYPYLR